MIKKYTSGFFLFLCSISIGSIRAQDALEIKKILEQLKTIISKHEFVDKYKDFLSCFSLQPQTLHEAIRQSKSSAVKSFLEKLPGKKIPSKQEKHELLQLAQDMCYVRRYGLCGLSKSPYDMGVMVALFMVIGIEATACDMLSKFLKANIAKQARREAGEASRESGEASGIFVPGMHYYHCTAKRRMYSTANMLVKCLAITGVICCLPKIRKAWRLEHAHEKLREAREIEELLIAS